MNRKMLIEKIRICIPNIKWLRNKIAETRVRALKRSRISSDMISKAEGNFELKKQLVEKCSTKWKKKMARLQRDIDEMVRKNPMLAEKPEWTNMEIDLKFCHFAYGFLPYEFVCYELYSKSEAERSEFVSNEDNVGLIFQMNDFVDVTKFNDKYQTYTMFKKYYHRECMSIESERDYKEFSDFVSRHHYFVKKEAFESLGKSVSLVSLSDDKETKQIFNTLISRGKHIIEEKIEQSPIMSAFNGSSVNTVRCITFKTNRGVYTPFCFMKTGREGSFVDNGGSGGIFISINEKTGVLNTTGADEVGRRFESHPDSGKPFIGFQLPEWESLISMCKEMAAQLDTVRYVGWDLAYTDKYGWVVVEGNARGQMIGPQTTTIKGARSKIAGLMADMELNF